MKKYIMLFTLCLIVQQNLLGKIKNGYGVEIKEARQSLSYLKASMEEYRSEKQPSKKMGIFQKARIKATINWLEEYCTYYELTERLLEQFRSIAPDLYNEIDTIKDSKGRPTDVYIKFMLEVEMKVKAAGTTNIAQGKEDISAYHSEYGPYTVSVRIAIGKKSLWFLAHELGHVKYQVPYLANYVEYYNFHYGYRSLQGNSFGHNFKDPSGNQAILYENEFNEHYYNYRENYKNKIKTPLALLQVIRKSY
ncbi:MAG: hypothetical protein ACR2MX_15845 [Cyclobacteriaceae bacterium]